jgi:hypothetical protein
MWSVARFKASGGIRGTGPKFWNVRLSFIPGLNAVECDRALFALSRREGIDEYQAIDVIDQMTRTMDGPSVLDACTAKQAPAAIESGVPHLDLPS